MNAMKRASSSVARYARAIGMQHCRAPACMTRHRLSVRARSAQRKVGRLSGGYVRPARGARTPPGGSGLGLLRSGSLAGLLAAAGPDEVEGVAVLDEVCVDRDGEARIVQLDREIIAAFAGALRPGGADLRAADIDPMAGGVLAGPVGLGDDADALGLDAQGYDFALILVAGLLEGADACHVTSPLLFEPRDHRGLDGDLQAEGDRRRTRLRAGAQRRMAAVRLSWLARNGRSPGEESLTAAVAAQAIEAQPSFGQIKPSEATWVAPGPTALRK